MVSVKPFSNRLIYLISTPAAARAVSVRISSGRVWLDTDGNRIEAHGGGILFHDGVYYWYGENKTHGAHNAVGVSCYSSRDLLIWKNEGVVMPKDGMPEQYRDTGVCERPKVIHNPVTGKFVMWMHLDADGYTASEAGVAVTDTPAGPFRFLRSFRPVRFDFGAPEDDRCRQEQLGGTFRDMNLFVDEDGRAYVFYASEGNPTMYVARLDPEFTGVEQPVILGTTWARILIGMTREAPAPFKYKGRYYLFSSDCTGWAPNPAMLAVADNIMGPWTSLGNPCFGPGAETTFESQSTFVLPAPGKPAGSFIFMADRWNGQNLIESTYVWLPFAVREDGSVVLEYLDSWNLDVFDHTSRMTVPTGVKATRIAGQRTVLSWKPVPDADGYRVLRNGDYAAMVTDVRYEIPPILAGRAYAWSVQAMTVKGGASPVSAGVIVSTGAPRTIFLDEVEPDWYRQGYGNLGKNRNILGGAINIAGTVYKHGLATHAVSEIGYHLCGAYSRFSSSVGCDDSHPGGTVEFVVCADGRELWRSGIMTTGMRAKKVGLSLKGFNELKLTVTDAGDGTHNDHADWAEARLTA